VGVSEGASVANRDEVFDQVKEILVDRLDIDEDDITIEAHLRDDLKADSLDLVELIMDLEERFGVKISDEEAQGIGTVGEAVDFIVAATE
jgi:acyl carrier protein